MAVSESQMESQMFVKSATFTVAGNELYSGFMAVGNVTLTIGSKDEKFELAMSEDGNYRIWTYLFLLLIWIIIHLLPKNIQPLIV